MTEAGLTPPRGAPKGYGGYVPLERLIELKPDYLVMASHIEQPDGQGALYLTHPALREMYPRAKAHRAAEPLHAVRGPEPDRRVRLSDRGGDAARGAGHDASAAHSATMPSSASSPSVSAAGPGLQDDAST